MAPASQIAPDDLETRLAWLLDVTDIGPWEYDHNRAHLNCSGTLATRPQEWQAADALKDWLPKLLTDKPSGAPYWTAEYRLSGPDGKSHWLSLRGHTFHKAGEAGTLLSAGIAYEVTAAKCLQHDLEAERLRLRTWVSMVPDLIWLKDQEGVYLACNPMFERFFGAREVDIVGKTDYDFVDKELADFFRDHDHKAMLADGPSVNEEWGTFADDGHKALLETSNTPMRDDGGRPIGVLGMPATSRPHTVTSSSSAARSRNCAAGRTPPWGARCAYWTSSAR